MTFDEAFKVIYNEKFGTTINDGTPRHSGEPEKIDFVISDDGIGTGIEKLDDLITQLKEEYAPTVEMTKEQYKIFNEDIQLNQTALDDYIDESMGLPKITNRQMLNLYTHPETIKIVDE